MKCVPIGQPDDCGPNERFDTCGPIDACEATCKNIELIGVRCSAVCIEKCVCEPGYVRGPDWDCIPVDTCTIGLIFFSFKIPYTMCNLLFLNSQM